MFATIISLLVSIGLATSSVPIDQPQTNSMLDGVRLVVCAAPKASEFWSGTMFDVGDNTYISAFHVPDGLFCLDAKTMTPLSILYVNSDDDLVIFRSPTKLDNVTFTVNCNRYVAGDYYWSIGWANGTDLKTIALNATPDYSPKGDQIEGKPFKHMRKLNGAIIPGMSGGPVLDKNWQVRGINNAVNSEINVSWSKELADTFICK